MIRGKFKEEGGISNGVQLRIQRKRESKLILFGERWRSINFIDKLKYGNKYKFYIEISIMKLLLIQGLVFYSVLSKFLRFRQPFKDFLKLRKSLKERFLKNVPLGSWWWHFHGHLCFRRPTQHTRTVGFFACL